MYSDSISKFLKTKEIKIGDVVKVETPGISEEGELMPNTEANSEDIMVIKLKNGYNVGLKFKDTKISKVEKGKGYGEFPKAHLKYKSGLPKIKLLYTGGTIGTKIDYTSGGVYYLTKPEELLHNVPEISEIAEIEVSTVSSIASEDLSSDIWSKLAKAVADALNKEARGIIITMGTDTMHYTSAALSFMLEGLNAPVVVTGAQRSPDRGSSDAFQNLICAAHIASKSNVAEVGVCMHNSSSDDVCAFIRATRVRKMHTSRRDAFRAMNSKPIALVNVSGDLDYLETYKKIDAKRSIKPLIGFEKKVALIKFYPNSDPEIIDFYVKKGYKGIIIEGTGLGHASTFTEDKNMAWFPHIKAAVENGVIVGMSSQCLYGRVNGNVYRALRMLSNAGVVYCEDMLPEVAYVKLGWLLGNYPANEAKDLLSKNLRGEIKNRSMHDEFLV